MADVRRRVSANELKEEISRVEDRIEKDFGFRPNFIDDITGLENNSFSNPIDPIQMESMQYYPQLAESSFYPIQMEPMQYFSEGEGSSLLDKSLGLNRAYLSTIYGSRPPVTSSRYIKGSNTTYLDVDYLDNRYVIEGGNRRHQTRSVVHVHEKGGVTWILDGGDITIYANGIEPIAFGEGQRFYMPPNTPMSANNLSDTNSMQLTIFVLPLNVSSTTLLEPWPTNPMETWPNPVPFFP